MARAVATAIGTTAAATVSTNNRSARLRGRHQRDLALAAETRGLSSSTSCSIASGGAALSGSTRAPGVGPGFTSAHGLTWTDEHGRREPQVRHTNELLARPVGHKGVQTQAEQVVVDGGYEVGETGRAQLVDDLRPE